MSGAPDLRTARADTAAVVGAVRWRTLAGGWAIAFTAGAGLAAFIMALGWWDEGGDWERAVLAWAQTTVSPTLDWVLLIVPFFGTNYTLAPAIAFACVYFWREGHKITALHLGVVQAGSWLLNPTLKILLDRPRPELFEQRGQHAFPAYPSGHVIAVTAVLFTVAYLIHRAGKGTWGYWVAAILLAINSYSRIYLSVHWPTDLIGGLIVGLIWLATCSAVFAPLHNRKDERPPVY